MSQCKFVGDKSMLTIEMLSVWLSIISFKGKIY